MRTTVLLGILVASYCQCSGTLLAQTTRSAKSKTTSREFAALMNRLAASWNSNNAKRAVECFTDDVVYSSPPSPRILRGRRALFEFFGGPKGRPRSMTMEWHHLLFDEGAQSSAGEYTFTYEVRTHGVVIVRIVNGRIANWREYEQESPLDWAAFVGGNRF